MTAVSNVTTIENLRDEARKLTPEQRLALIDEILGTIDAVDLDHQWAEEAKDRYEAYRRGEMKGRTLEEILEKYDKK